MTTNTLDNHEMLEACLDRQFNRKYRNRDQSEWRLFFRTGHRKIVILVVGQHPFD